MLTRVNLALHAHALLIRDVDYLVRDGRVHLVNQSRGRVATLQRWHGAPDAGTWEHQTTLKVPTTAPRVARVAA